MKKGRLIVLLSVVITVLLISGCQSFNLQQLIKKDLNPEPVLIKVRIHFDRGDTVDGYVYELGLEQSGKLYSGGSSLSYIYDLQGHVVGSFNYQRVTHMEIIPAGDEDAT